MPSILQLVIYLMWSSTAVIYCSALPTTVPAPTPYRIEAQAPSPADRNLQGARYRPSRPSYHAPSGPSYHYSPSYNYNPTYHRPSYYRPTYYGPSYYGPTYYHRPTYRGGGCGVGCATLIVISIIPLFVCLIWCLHSCTKINDNRHDNGDRNYTEVGPPMSEEVWVSMELSDAYNPEVGNVHEPPCLPSGKFAGTYTQHGDVWPIRPFDLYYKTSQSNPLMYDVIGEGSDDVGDYTLTGLWVRNRLAMTKQYKIGTGNPDDNHGHKVHIRLEKRGDSLEGTYTICESFYSGRGDYKIYSMESPVVVAAAVPSTPVEEIPVVTGTLVPTETQPLIDKK